MPPCDVKLTFVLRHWTAEHGVQLCVGNKLLLIFLLTCLHLWEIFFQDVKRKKRILSDDPKPPEFIKRLLMQTPFNKSCLNFLGKKLRVPLCQF